jgi:ABC-type uncharacterized transport system YnjBCD permease subunit
MHKNFLKLGVVGSIMSAIVVGFEAIASATAYDPTSALTARAGNATSTASPILIGVTVAMIPLLIVFLVVGWVKGLFGRRRH